VEGVAGKPTFRRKECGKLDDNVLSDSREKSDNGNSLVRKLLSPKNVKNDGFLQTRMCQFCIKTDSSS